MNKNLARVLDIELNVSVILGRTKMALKDIFELGKGSLIELDTFENQEVEIVVIDQNFGVRITNILGEDELVKTLS